ncbi:MAG: peptidyl-tRNA hydrolase PTH2-domain-containing protein [Linnemannia elongata]|nr:MAG: peptidyl-tRNA hydrolase PTH2-domain-containing protein [Linnemannia elongata]
MDKSFTLGHVLSAGAVGLLTGYFFSQSALKHKSKEATATEEKKKSTNNKAGEKKSKDNSNKHTEKDQDVIEEDSENYSENDEDFTDEEDSEDEENEALADFDLQEEYKMVLVIRTDLNMGKGKAAAQCCHATLANYKELSKKSPKTLSRWEYFGQAKVTLKVDNEEDMLMLQAQAMSIGLAAHSIRDAGRTQIAAGSRTVLAIGPGPISVVNSITGKLKLY